MLPLQTQLLSGVMVGFALFIALGWIVTARVYNQLGYPPIPPWLRTIRLSDDMDAVYDKLRCAFDEGFELKRHDVGKLIIEKEIAEPRCLLRFEASRGLGSSQCFSVRCVDRWWLNRSVGKGRNW